MARLIRLVRDENYPYDAETSITVCPDLVDPKVYGPHRSVVSAQKIRYWAFAEEKGRDLFFEHMLDGRFNRKVERQ